MSDEFEMKAADILNRDFVERIIYQTGYIIKENGDITLPDGTLPAPGVTITISKEHLDIAIERKRRSEGKA